MCVDFFKAGRLQFPILFAIVFGGTFAARTGGADSVVYV